MKAKNYVILSGMLMAASSMTSCTNGDRTIRESINYAMNDDFRDSKEWGKVISQEVAVAAFSGIDLKGCADVDYYQDDDVSVIIKGNKKAIALYEVSVNGDLLTVRMKDEATHYKRVPEVLIEVHAPALWKVKTNGTGDVEMKNSVKLDGDLLVDATGTGDVDADDLKCHNLTVKHTGTGDVDIEGKAKSVTAHVTGTGDTTLKISACKDMTIVANGTGDVDLKVDCENLDITANGTGDVEAKGSCINLTKREKGLATIWTKDLKIANIKLEN